MRVLTRSEVMSERRKEGNGDVHVEMETECVVGPPGSEPLLGQIVLERLDLLVDCAQEKLVPRPESPYLPLLKLK